MALRRNDRCNRIGSRCNSWENPLMMKELMAKDYEVGAAGSLTMIVLFSSVVFLLRSFYKRYTRLQQNAEQMRENEDDN
jgi:hypothetical protein